MPTPAKQDAMIAVHHVIPEDVRDPELIKRLQSWLDDQELSRWRRFVRPQDQHRFLVSHALMRAVLGQALGCHPKRLQFTTTGRDKPVVLAPAAGAPIHFNLSHTEGLTAMAVSWAPVGIDTEWLKRQVAGQDLAKRYFTASELADIATDPVPDGHHRFLSYWTLKEAFLKAEGWGIVDRLDGFEFELSPKDQWPPQHIELRVHNTASMPTRQWRFYQWQVTPDHVLSLAACAQQAQHTTVNLAAWGYHDWALAADGDPVG